MQMRPKGDEAARLRKQKYDWLRRFKIPPEALPGSLSLTHRRCGKPNCCCVEGDRHPLWQLTFMVDGKKRVERILKRLNLEGDNDVILVDARKDNKPSGSKAGVSTGRRS